MFEEQIRTHRATFEQLVNRDLAALNSMLQQRGITNVVAGSPE